MKNHGSDQAEWAGRLPARTVSSGCSPTIPGFQTVCGSSLRSVKTVYDLAERNRVSLRFNKTGKNLGVRRRYPPVLNDARYTGPVAR
jgi:hypothetical protein